MKLFQSLSQSVGYQRLEAAFLFVACLFFYHLFNFNFWFFVLLLFTVDIFMLGYLINPKIGAHLYNIGHSMIIPAILLCFAVMYASSLLLSLGIIWLAHIGWDRAFGYGLKFSDGFKHTHLGNL